MLWATQHYHWGNVRIKLDYSASIKLLTSFIWLAAIELEVFALCN